MTDTAIVPIDALDRMAGAFASSGMFGAKNKEQALALLLLAQAEGVHPAIAMRDFDIINGKPAKKAEAMHRSFLAAGGKVEWHKLDDTCADATFSHPSGGTARITWDLERVKKAKIANAAMYEKFPRPMLRSRCVSEGCRTVYPAATSGMYEPGEQAGIPQSKEKDMGAAVVVHDEKSPQLNAVQLKKALRESSEKGIEEQKIRAHIGHDAPWTTAEMNSAWDALVPQI